MPGQCLKGESKNEASSLKLLSKKEEKERKREAWECRPFAQSPRPPLILPLGPEETPAQTRVPRELACRQPAAAARLQDLSFLQMGDAATAKRRRLLPLFPGLSLVQRILLRSLLLGTDRENGREKVVADLVVVDLEMINSIQKQEQKLLILMLMLMLMLILMLMLMLMMMMMMMMMVVFYLEEL